MSLLLALQDDPPEEPAQLNINKNEGGGIKTRRRISTQPAWVPEYVPDDEEALLIILGAA